MAKRSAFLLSLLILCLAGAAAAADRGPPGKGRVAVPSTAGDEAGETGGEKGGLAGFLERLFSGDDEAASESEPKVGFGETGKTRFFDFVEWFYRKSGDAAPEPASQPRPVGSPRLKNRSGDAPDFNMHAFLFKPPPSWVAGAAAGGGASGIKAASRRRATSRGREVEFDLYLWFLTELPKRRVRAYAERAEAAPPAETRRPFPGR